MSFMIPEDYQHMERRMLREHETSERSIGQCGADLLANGPGRRLASCSAATVMPPECPAHRRVVVSSRPGGTIR
jgi:hypothetical protein